jgi:undecaprenyl-phosphate 4-deoxy-4-formamido-L-arabinose transferase
LNPQDGLSVVVPVYNGRESLSELVGRLSPLLETAGPGSELIMVDDGSSDDSWSEIVRLSSETHWVRGLRLRRNYGQHNALLCGVRAASAPVVVTMDDDLQNPPEEIPKLLKKLDEGFDVVYGYPEHERHPPWRRLASVMTKLVLQKSMGAKTARRVSAFRAFRTDMREAFAGYGGAFVSLDVLLTWATTSFGAVPVRHERRKHGSSNYTVRRLIVHALNMMTGFSTIPLEVASLLGFFFTLFGMGILVYVLARYVIEGGSVPGFPFLASIISIFSGVQLFSLGIIGEYLARMHFRVMDKPSYSVRDRTEAGPDNRDP